MKKFNLLEDWWIAVCLKSNELYFINITQIMQCVDSADENDQDVS